VIGSWILIPVLAALLFAPPSQRAATIDPAVVQQGAHGADVLDAPTHTAYRCDQCHARGGTAVTLPGWTAQTNSCVVYCHRAFGGGTAASVQWQSSPQRLTCAACHGFPPDTGAHATHARKDRYAIGCLVCHGGNRWSQHHTTGSIYIGLQQRAGATAVYDTGTCTNVACHSNGRGESRPVRWTDGPLTCSSCHDDETTAAPRMSGQHLRHFRIGVACADCHGAVVDRAKQIMNRTLHDNGTVDVNVLSGGYSAGSCTPACHEPRMW